jgi:hypothetical protein
VSVITPDSLVEELNETILITLPHYTKNIINEMSMNDLPIEILGKILRLAVTENERGGVQYTYGLSKLPPSFDHTIPTKIQRYVRGPIPPYQQKWDSTQAVRLVCQQWHEWSMEYAMRDLYIRNWKGSEIWCDLTILRSKYPFYELNRPYGDGEKVFRDPHLTLKRTTEFLRENSEAAAKVRRVWFDGLHVPETDKHILSILRSCPNLDNASIPWTLLHHASAEDWAALLQANKEPLRSLELRSITPTSIEVEQISKVPFLSPLASPLVDFSKLRRLKLVGNSNIIPIGDDDLKAIARTATNLEVFRLTGIGSVTIEGVMAIVRASRKTLRVLDFSPRSEFGFNHPDPGHMSDGEHVCDILTSCPRLKDLSISIPTMCRKLFENRNVQWTGECQVRALGLCGMHEDKNMPLALRTTHAHEELRRILLESRKLMNTRASSYVPAELVIELFFADMIFDPHVSIVHGDFQEACEMTGGDYPRMKEPSPKGPYGSSGLYEKMGDETVWEQIGEEELFSGLGRGLIQL